MDINRLSGGLWPVMLTPFMENYKIDEEGLKMLTHFYIRSGANGLFPNCLSSEMFQLTDDERLWITRTVVNTATQDNIPVVATGTFNSSIEKCAEFIKRMYDTGVAAVVVLSNQIVNIDENEDVFKKRIEKLLGLTGNIPLGMYECPYPYKRLISPEMMGWLAETNRFYYHKDTSCDPAEIKLKLEAVKGTSFAFYNADTPTALLSLKQGATGISPIGANFYPELYSFLISMFKNKAKPGELSDLDAKLTVMGTVVDLCYPFSAKLFLQQRGLPITSVCRITYDKMRPDGYLKLQALMEIFKTTKEQLEYEYENN